MTSYNLTQAVDVALAFTKAKKFCLAKEDDNAYYITVCGDNGEPIHAPCTCRVDKKELTVRMCYRGDHDNGTKKKEVRIPDDVLYCYIPFDDVWVKQ